MKIIKSLVAEFEDYPHHQISSIIELIKRKTVTAILKLPTTRKPKPDRITNVTSEQGLNASA